MPEFLSRVRPAALPPDALLATYAGRGAHTDCYMTEIDAGVVLAGFVESFYTGAAFRPERWLLALFLSRPSTDAQVRQLAAGEIDAFAAWRVEARTPSQLLLCDIAGRTRSWLMVLPVAGGTRLYFGSAVVPAAGRRDGTARLGVLFHALLGFHRLYSRVLLGGARAGLAARARRFSRPPPR